LSNAEAQLGQSQVSLTEWRENTRVRKPKSVRAKARICAERRSCR